MLDRRAVGALAVVLALGVMASACGDDDDASSAAASTTTAMSTEEQLCTDRQGLQDSLTALRDVDVVAQGTSGVSAALTGVKESVSALKRSVVEEFRPELDALDDATDNLEDAVDNIDDDGVAGVASALRATVTAAGALLDRLQSIDCG